MSYHIVTIETCENYLGKRLREMGADEYQAMATKHPYLDLPIDQNELRDWWSGKFVGTFDDVAALAADGIECNIKRVRGILTERLIPDAVGAQNVINNVAIPNVGMFAVTRLRVLEDQCTDYVQRWLDDGWRIVAVCPPNDTRRPTYILGHMDYNAGEPR